MLGILLTIVHVVVAVFLIMVVLLQTGKRADLAGAFGGGGSQTAFGTRGAATLLSKLTTAAAVAFMLTSLSLALLGSRSAKHVGDTVLPEDEPAQTQQAPGPVPQLPATPTSPAESDSSTDPAQQEPQAPDTTPPGDSQE